MSESLMQFDDGQLVFLASVVGMAVIPVTILSAIGLVQFRKLRERQLELGFRNDLLHRGYSVDEVVRLVSCRRPSWSQSLMMLCDWAGGRFSRGLAVVGRKTQSLLRATVPVLRSAWRECSSLARDLWREGRPLVRQAARHGGQFCVSLWREARPLLRTTLRSAHQCLQWLGDQADRLIRQLAPHRS